MPFLNQLKAFEMPGNRGMLKIKWVYIIRNNVMLDRIREKRTFWKNERKRKFR